MHKGDVSVFRRESYEKEVKMDYFRDNFSVLFIPLTCLLVFISKTINAGGVDQYCLENTETSADSFGNIRYEVYEEGNFVEYAFWVAEKGLSGRQELFMFQQVQFASFQKSRVWDRFRFVYHALGGEGEQVGSVMFTPRDFRDRKQTTNWMVFYSENKEYIYKCIFSADENGKLYTIEKAASINMVFIIVFLISGKRMVL